MPTTANLLLPYPDPLAEADVPADIQALSERLEAISVWSRVGLAADRPPVGTVPAGARWLATDTFVESVKIGAAWVDVLVGFPLGVCIPYTGEGDPAGGVWLLADGRLLPSATYTAYDIMIGAAAPVGKRHVYNAGVDPLGGQFRIPDKRGRVSVGAGTATGAAGATAKTRGVRAGEETHVLTTGEAAQKAVSTGSDTPDHTHSGAAAASGSYGQGLFAGTTVPGAYLALNPPPYYSTAGVNNVHHHDIAGSAAASAHPNMQPYEVDNWIVRVR